MIAFKIGASEARMLRQWLFHQLCRRDTESGRPDQDDLFDAGYRRRTRHFLDQFGGRIVVAGKRILDVGCGRGSATLYLAEQGAAQVVGVDPLADRIVYARSRLAADFLHLSDRVSFTHGTAADLAGSGFDLLISKHALEHVDQVGTHLAELRFCLRPGGLMALGYGPLWYSPTGGHIAYMTKVPWAHLLFPEHVIMAERRRFKDDGIESWSDLVNRLPLAAYERAFRDSGLEAIWTEANVGRGRAMRVMRLARRLPGLRDFATVNVFGLWRVPERESISGPSIGSDPRDGAFEEPA